MQPNPFVFIPLLIIVILIFLILLILARIFKARGEVTRALNLNLFLVRLPQRQLEPEKEATAKGNPLAVMEQLYESLGNFKEKGLSRFFYGQPYLVFEIVNQEGFEETSFYYACPAHYETMLEKLIHGLYPEAEIEKVDDYNIFSPQGKIAGAHFLLSKSYLLPLKTYQRLETDPLQEILNAFSKLKTEGEGAAIQMVLRPASPGWKKSGLKVVSEMQKGQSFSAARTKVTSPLTSVTTTLAASKKSEEQEPSQPKPITPGQQEQINAIEQKIRRAGFETNLRIIVSAETQSRADEILDHLTAPFNQFNDPNLNQLTRIRLKARSLRRLIYRFSFRLPALKQKMLLAAEELASIFHFPSQYLAVPKVKFLKAKSASAPANLPKQGVILGANIYRGQENVIRLQKEDRHQHLYIVGQTGTGKSALIQEIAKQDIEAGQGTGLIDPHGDLIEAVLRLIPETKTEDVILIDPADLKQPVGLNMLEYDPKYPEQKTFIINELINIFDKLYDLKVTGGPIFEQYTRNALQLLMDDASEPATLMEVPRVLSDREYRERLLAKCQNIVVKDFWEKEAAKAEGEAALKNLVPYITSKFNVFIANDYMRPIIGQAKSSFNFREVLDKKNILLVNLSKGKLGEINSSLLGLIVVGKILLAALSRADLSQEQRQDFYLYIDEFQNFTTESIITILSEARKYRLNLTLAHQFIGQLPEKIRQSVFGNVGSMISFRVGVEDTEFLTKQFEPNFDKNDLINIDNFNAYVKLMINGQTSTPFNIKTYPPSQGPVELAQSIRQLSSSKYGRPRAEVEEEILRRLKT